MKTPDYYCKTCGSTCANVGGQVTRNCRHDDAPIVAERTSTLYGEGAANESMSLKQRIVSALLKIMGVQGV
jgi:hypothetical protein